MTGSRIAIVAFALTMLAGCGRDTTVAGAPPPHPITEEAVGHYCGMNLIEHAGPKGQILLNGSEKPVWFTTIKQTFAYTLLPEEPKGIRVIYVNDMGRVTDPEQLRADAWIDARQAFYVIESSSLGGMGAEDAMPFGELSRAQEFVDKHGGRIVQFDEMPENYILNFEDAAQAMKAGNEPFSGEQQ